MPVSRTTSLRIRLFARYAELLGAETLDLDVALPATVGDIVAHVKALYPVAAALPDRPLVAVNMRQVSPEHVVQPGDEVAILPPVAGG